MSTVATPARNAVREAISTLTGNGRRPAKDPTFHVEDVTPAKAEQWLARNTRNRKVKAATVSRYATEMRNGRWMLNAEPIKFDTDGNLIDGQHRLAAIINSGATVRMTIARGIAATTFATMDQGSKRSGGDHLHLMGEVNTNHLAVAVAHLRRYERGDLHNTGTKYFVSGPEIIETLERYPGIRDSLKAAHYTGVVGSVGLFGFFHYVFSQKDRALADWFVASLAGGEGLKSTDAVWRLRETLLRHRSQRTRLHPTEVMKLTILAWNKHRASEDCRQLRTTAEFPTIE